MKARKTRRYANEYRYRRAYPNAADSSYFTQKFLDGITSVVTGMGIVFILLFLITL